MKNYIIVGGGFAGMFLALELLERGLDFTLYADPTLPPSSKISAGVCNPVVLKRFTTFDRASEQLERVRKTEEIFNRLTGSKFILPAPVARIFSDAKEKELWGSKPKKNENLQAFLNPEIQILQGIPNPEGIGRVNHSFRIDVPGFFSVMESYLQAKGVLRREKFDYSKLKGQVYNSQRFDHIIFAEGKDIKQNPWFNFLPVEWNKGHQLEVRVGIEDPNFTLKKRHFLFPLTQDSWYYGGTYDRFDVDPGHNPKAIHELESALEGWLGSFETLAVHSGFRPTVPDRKPLLGPHPEHPMYYIFNGMGARGVMNAAWYSSALVDFIEANQPLPAEADWRRYFK